MRPVMTRIGNSRSGFKSAGKALFHHWGVDTIEADTGFGNYTVAVVEYPDGRVDIFPPANILFLDVQDQGQALIDTFTGEAKVA